MSYFMRYVTREDKRLSLERLEKGLKLHNDAYSLVHSPERSQSARLMCGNEFLGTLYITRSQDGCFEHDLVSLRKRLPCSGGDAEEIEDLLKNAEAFVTLQVAWGDREAEETQDMLDPLWALLFERWEGLLHADNDGWHDPFGLVLPVA